MPGRVGVGSNALHAFPIFTSSPLCLNAARTDCVPIRNYRSFFPRLNSRRAFHRSYEYMQATMDWSRYNCSRYPVSGMQMKYATIFFIFGALLAFLALRAQPFSLLLVWPALSCILLALGYAGIGPGILGKSSNGSLVWWSILLFLPYLMLSYLLWHFRRCMSRDPAANEIVPNVWLGRRPLPADIPRNVDTIVDLTAEFSEIRAVMRGRKYVTIPTLDTQAPNELELRQILPDLSDPASCIYIHCAMGHGRSATLAAAVLLFRKCTQDPDEALAIIRRSRPAVSLSPAQFAFLNRIAKQLQT